MRGTFHFHSNYSHDGRNELKAIESSLRAQGYSFCIMTEHFEDFDAEKFDRYLQEVGAINRQPGFLLIPGMEIKLSGIDTIVFPAPDYEACGRFARDGSLTAAGVMTVVAHPSKYSYKQVVRHLDRFKIEGIELWNQQADGGHMPPFAFINSLSTEPWRARYTYLFGCDLHDISLTVANVLTLPETVPLEAGRIVAEIRAGRFVSTNLRTGIEHRNSPEPAAFDRWWGQVRSRSYGKARFLKGVRRTLKVMYDGLPRPVRRSLNHFKNRVRNKI